MICAAALLWLVGCGGGSGGGGGTTIAPTIAAQPLPQTVTAPTAATFSVTANGTAPLSYQWQNAATSANNSGATSSSYTISPTTTAESGMRFQVVVTNAAGSITSNAVTLTVNSGPPPPSNVTVLTYHSDVARTGQNLSETTLTTD